MIPIFDNVMNPIRSPYKPCVPGSNCIISTFANFDGSSVITPDAACPAIPTPIAEPAPAISTASAAPSNA